MQQIRRQWKPALAALLLLAAGSAVAAERPVDKAGSEIGFSVKQMGVPVSGRFTRYDAKIDLDVAKPELSRAELSVEIASLTTGDADSDAVALDKPWLNKLDFPKATFKSTTVRALGPNRYEAKGLLTIRGKPREVTVPFAAQDLSGGATLLSGQFTLRRADFGIGGGEWNEGDLVANDVPVTFKLKLAPAR
jgi:polyisoprenoid-binding protein YceI